MPSRDIAGDNLAILQTYAPDSYKSLEKKFRESDDKATRKAMLDWMVEHHFGDEKAPGHMSGKPGDKMQKGTEDFIKAVATALR